MCFATPGPRPYHLLLTINLQDHPAPSAGPLLRFLSLLTSESVVRPHSPPLSVSPRPNLNKESYPLRNTTVPHLASSRFVCSTVLFVVNISPILLAHLNCSSGSRVQYFSPSHFVLGVARVELLLVLSNLRKVSYVHVPPSIVLYKSKLWEGNPGRADCRLQTRHYRSG